MEALRREDPRRFGRFTVLARFQEAASAVQYVARDTGTGELAVITAARPALAAVPAFRRRFQAEARTAERLAGGWVTPPLETGSLETGSPEAGEDELLWTATAYVPALPLAEAVGIAGPLPERALRILGAGIAEILSRVHAGGSVLQGLAPGTVLLAEDGPRLTAFGPLGAAAAAEARPGGQLSVRLGYLTPEQVAGREVGAPSDLFVLGLLLAYAATGTTPFTEGPPEEAARRIAEADPELDAVPEELRELIAGCLAKDPAERPTAGTVAAELALEGAAGLARGGWLPERLAAAVADQEARVRALEAPEEAEATGTAGSADPAGEPEDAVPADAVPGAAAEAPEDAPATPTPTDPRATVATTDETPGTSTTNAAPGTATGTSANTGDIGEDRGTTRFLNTGPKPPQSDRATTHLALPPGLPPAPGTTPAPSRHRPTTTPTAAPPLSGSGTPALRDHSPRQQRQRQRPHGGAAPPARARPSGGLRHQPPDPDRHRGGGGRRARRGRRRGRRDRRRGDRGRHGRQAPGAEAAPHAPRPAPRAALELLPPGLRVRPADHRALAGPAAGGDQREPGQRRRREHRQAGLAARRRRQGPGGGGRR
ncbi:protein of unknown function [Streptomyces sp. KY75]|nr:protein of unknown function [Streptomyces sp. KY75]